MARLGRVLVTYELLEQLLSLPEEATIRRVTNDNLFNRGFEIIVHSPSLSDVADGAEIPLVDYTVTRYEGEFLEADVSSEPFVQGFPSVDRKL